MAVVQLLVELPDGMSLASLRELLEMHDATMHECKRVDGSPPASPPNQTSVPLTPTELSILKAFSYCDTNEEIAAQVGLSLSTVKSHTEDIFRKLRVHSRACALGRALRLGRITLRDLTPPPKGGEKSAKRRRDKK